MYARFTRHTHTQNAKDKIHIFYSITACGSIVVAIIAGFDVLILFLKKLKQKKK